MSKNVVESRPYTWDELCSYEQEESNRRGFPRESNTRYIVDLNSRTFGKDNLLVRWTTGEVK
jgi:hypothetical protein